MKVQDRWGEHASAFKKGRYKVGNVRRAVCAGLGIVFLKARDGDAVILA